MTQFIKKNLTLILAFLVPIFFILFVAINAYVPALGISTKYNFVYTSCATDSSNDRYNCEMHLPKVHTVENNKLVFNEINPTMDSDKDGTPDVKENYQIRIFLHDTATNSSREISLEDAQKLKLNKLLTSPDGVTISSNYNNSPGFMLFDGGSSYGYYLTKGGAKSRLHLINDGDRYAYQNNFHFIGWVLP